MGSYPDQQTLNQLGAQPGRRDSTPGQNSRARNSRARNNRAEIVALACLAAAFLFPALLLAGAYAYFQVFGLIAPGVRVGHVSLSGMSVAQAAETLNQSWNDSPSLTVSDGSRTWSSSPLFFGLWMDPGATAEAAYAVGRGAAGLGDLAGLVYNHGQEISPQVRFDAQAAQSQLERWAPLVALAPQDASLRLEGGQVVTVPAALGYNLDIHQTLIRLASDPAGILASGKLTLALTPVAPRVTDVSAAAAQAQSLLERPLNVLAYDPITDERIPWSVPREVVATWLRVTQAPDGVSLSLDESQAAPYFEQWGATLGPARSIQSIPDDDAITAAWRSGQPVVLLLRHAPTEYTVQAGDTLLKIAWKAGMPLWHITDANPGLSENNLTTGQVLQIPSKNDLLPLPVVVNKRIVISISQQRLRTYQDGSLLNEYVISTGIDSSPTQPGVYQVQTHDPNAYAQLWDLYMPNFLGIYEAWPGFMNGIHGLPMLSSGQRLWANVLGRPASYGCIILSLQDAETVYNWAENGVVVEITP